MTGVALPLFTEAQSKHSATSARWALLMFLTSNALLDRYIHVYVVIMFALTEYRPKIIMREDVSIHPSSPASPVYPIAAIQKVDQSKQRFFSSVCLGTLGLDGQLCAQPWITARDSGDSEILSRCFKHGEIILVPLSAIEEVLCENEVGSWAGAAGLIVAHVLRSGVWRSGDFKGNRERVSVKVAVCKRVYHRHYFATMGLRINLCIIESAS